MEEFRLIKGYQKDNKLRKSFNELAQKTFGLSFEDWYQNGYWTDHYIPYSMVCQEEIVANVSVNIMEMWCDGIRKRFLQLGTVMTKEEYRRKGLIRRLMEEIQKEYAGKVDGMYLFANDGVLDFYPKFGFHRAAEYQYIKRRKGAAEPLAAAVSVKNKEELKKLEEAILASTWNARLGMDANLPLIMFYVTKFMQDNVYFVESENAYVIAMQEGSSLYLQEVIADHQVELDKVIAAFGTQIREAVLGFTPLEQKDCEVRIVEEEDTTLFVDQGFAEWEKEKWMFPVLSHA